MPFFNYVRVGLVLVHSKDKFPEVLLLKGIKCSEQPVGPLLSFRALVLGFQDFNGEAIQGSVGVGHLWEHGPQVGDVRHSNSNQLQVREVVSVVNLEGKHLFHVPFFKMVLEAEVGVSLLVLLRVI